MIESIGVNITVALALVAYGVAFFKWLNKLAESITSLGVRFEERTGAMISDMRKMGQTLDQLASVRTELSRLHEQSKDHEVRIRQLEFHREQDAE